MDKKHIRVNKAPKPTEIAPINMEEANNVVQEAQEYNARFMDIPENYKTIRPNGGQVLVKLRLCEDLMEVVTSFHKETNHAQTKPICYWGFDASKKGQGIIISGGEFGTKVVVSPEAFFTDQGQLNQMFNFTTPEHQEVGYFLIPNRFILATY